MSYKSVDKLYLNRIMRTIERETRMVEKEKNGSSKALKKEEKKD
jgi:hypothetical protein